MTLELEKRLYFIRTECDDSSHHGIVCSPRSRLVHSKAVEVARAARRAEVVLAASARGVRRIPGLRGLVVPQSHAIVMSDDRSTVAAQGPVAARRFRTTRHC